MALTATHQVSGVYQPSNNHNLWVIEESSTGITSNFNFKFLCDVKNTSGTLLSRLKVPIYFGSGNKGVVNISKVLSAYTTYDWDFDDSASSGCTNSAFDYNLSFGYEYSTGATSDIQVSTGVTNVTGNTVWNAALHPLDFLNYSQNAYLMASGSTANFLTSLSSKRIYADQKEWLYALHNSAIGYLSVNWSDVTRNLVYNSVLDGGATPTFWSLTPGGVVSPTGSTLSPYDTAYLCTASASRSFFESTNTISLEANSTYWFSFDLEEITGTIAILRLISVGPPQTYTYYLNGVLLPNPSIAATTGRISIKFTTTSAITIRARFGIGVETFETGTALISRPQLIKGATDLPYIPTKLISSTANKITRYPIGANIQGGIPTGASGLIVTPIQTGGAVVGSDFTISYDTRCSKFEQTDVFFLNKYGAVESFRFNRLRRDNFTTTRNTYRKNPYKLTGSSYNFDNLTHSKSDYYNEQTQTTTLNSDFITETEAVWLKQLINSPRVWMYDTQLIPINVRTSTYEQKYHFNDKVFNLTLEVEHSFIDKSQAL